ERAARLQPLPRPELRPEVPGAHAHLPLAGLVSPELGRRPPRPRHDLPGDVGPDPVGLRSVAGAAGPARALDLVAVRAGASARRLVGGAARADRPAVDRRAQLLRAQLP